MIDEPTTYRRLLQDPDGSVDRFDREVLLAHAIDRDRAWIWSHLDDQVENPKHLEQYDQLLAQRTRGHPVAYLLGYREFYARRFYVSPEVLIPRPETELLIELALDLLPKEKARVIDVGTGSGAIGLTLAAERPEWAVLASDLSESALAVASINRDQLALDRVELAHCDLLSGLSDRRFDLVISNPPYVAEGDPHLDSGDLRYEPAIALASGHDGLDLIRLLINQAAQVLDTKGWLLFEHGYDQAEAVRALLDAHGFEATRSWTDLSGIERASGGRLAT